MRASMMCPGCLESLSGVMLPVPTLQTASSVILSKSTGTSKSDEISMKASVCWPQGCGDACRRVRATAKHSSLTMMAGATPLLASDHSNRRINNLTIHINNHNNL